MESEEQRDRAQTQANWRDQEAFNSALAWIHDAFLEVHAALFDEERWRWNAPVITFTWQDSDGISRNLNGLVLGGFRPTAVEIDSNAWRDIQKKHQLVRTWCHFRAGRIDFVVHQDWEEVPTESITALVKKAYSKAVSWTEADLKETEPLTSIP